MITAAQAAAIVKARRLIVEPSEGGWRAYTSDHTRLHKGGFPSYEEAVEAAEQAFDAADVGRVRADKVRLFDFCAAGSAWVQPRRSIDTEGSPTVVWDAFRFSDSSRIVARERSYHAAVIAAEAIINPPPTQNPQSLKESPPR